MNILLLLPALFLMTACHQNPLKSESPEKTVAFLIEASRAAEKNTPFHDLKGAAYSQCMTNNPLQLDCSKLFRDMLCFARDVPDFNSTTLADLHDKSLFQSLSERYQQQQFNTL
jgi:hypothetical protein